MPQDKTGHFYYSWYPTIFQADTQTLTIAEDGAYRRLIDHYMITRTPLLNDDRALARIIGIGLEEWLTIKPMVVPFFKPSDNPAGYLRHAFCDEALVMHNERIESSRRNGKKGGRPSLKNKDNNPAETQPVMENNPVGYENVTQQKPITEHNITEVREEKITPGGVIQKKPKNIGTRFSIEELPSDWKAFCEEKRPDLDPESVFEQFRDFWIGKPGKDGVKADWAATWRNWCRNQKPGDVTQKRAGVPTPAKLAQNLAFKRRIKMHLSDEEINFLNGYEAKNGTISGEIHQQQAG